MWILKQEIHAPPGGNYWGWSLAASASTLAVGASGTREGGSVYIYQPVDGSRWRIVQRITNPAAVPPYAQFGLHVSVSGSDVAVGSLNTAYVFTETGGTWTQQGDFQIAGATGDYPGYLVALWKDRLVISVERPTGSEVYRRANGVWSEAVTLPSVSPVGSLALSRQALLVGIPSDAAGLVDSYLGPF